MRTTWAAAVIATAVLGGCATNFHQYQEAVVRDQEKKVMESQLKNDLLVDQAKSQKSGSVVVSDKAFLGVKSVPLVTLVKPPEFLSRRVELVQEVSSISELIDPLSGIAKVPVVVRDDALLAAARGASMYSIAPVSASGPVSASPASASPVSSAMGAGASSAAGSGPVSFRFSGPLSSLLDLVAARFGLSWRHTPVGMIEFYHRDTRTFPVMVLPGDLTASTSIGTSGGSSSAGGSSGGSAGGSSRTATQTTQATVSVTFWKSLEESVNAIKSRDGIVTVNSSAGTVTVTDTPVVLDRIGKLIEDQNTLLSKQVLIDVKVVTLKLVNSEALGIDWSLVYQKVGGNTLGFGSKFGTSMDPTSSAGSALIFSTKTGNLDNTAAIIKALADQANVSDVTSAQQFALNNQPTPIQVGATARYVESYTKTFDTLNSVPTVTVTTGSVTSGVSLQLLPRILDNQNMLIHLSADLSEAPEGLKPTDFGGVSVSLWTQNVRNFMQRVALKSGETLVLSGYENNSNRATKSGVGTPDNQALGGTREAKAERTLIVIMITPVIMDRIRS